MSITKNIRTLLQCAGINLLLLLAAAVTDILLSALMLRFSSRAFTIACFAVAGVFAGVYCCVPAQEPVAITPGRRAARHRLIWTTIMGAFLFTVIAPLSGWEYNWPVRFFAVAEVVTAVFLWKNKLYSNTETPGRNGPIK